MMRKVLVFVLIAGLGMTAAALAQGRPGPPSPPPGQNGPPGPPPPPPNQPDGPAGPQAGPPPEVVLKELLGFTDEQLARLKELAETRRQATEALQTQIAEAERALAEAMKAANPDPAQVGAKLLALDALRRQLGPIEEVFHQGLNALLTGEQKQKVEGILALQAQLQAGEALRRLGF
jgi:Spy/CpxP family protein refolding chaperone